MGQVEWARELAGLLLAEPLPGRWAHTQGVASTARRLASILGEDAELIEAAAWLHDIGYAPNIARVGFHPLDGARYLRAVANGAATLCSLVAHHSAALYEARERGLESQLTGEFALPPRPLADALTYCDITTGPDGSKVSVVQRLADIQDRYASDHPVSRAVRQAAESYLESVRAIEARLMT